MIVAWTRRSLLRLAQIRDFISRDQPDNASRFVSRLLDRGDSDGVNPRRGRIVPEYQIETIRELFERDERQAAISNSLHMYVQHKRKK